MPRSQAAELRQLLGLRDAVTGLLDAEARPLRRHTELDRLRRDLSCATTPTSAPTARSTGSPGGTPGAPTRPPGRRSWRGSARPRAGSAPTRSPLWSQALEEFDPVSQHAAKAAIFTRRVVAPRNPRLGADTPADALAICLDVCGEVRLAGIARLLGID